NIIDSPIWSILRSSASSCSAKKRKAAIFHHGFPYSHRNQLAKPTAHSRLRSVSVPVAASETFTIRSGEITEACFLKIVRPFRIVAAIVRRIALAGLQSVVIALVHRSVGTTKDVLIIVVESVEPVRIIERIVIVRSIVWPIRSHDHDASLCLRSRARKQCHDTGEKQRG